MARQLDRFPDPVADRAKEAIRHVEELLKEQPQDKRALDDVAFEMGLSYGTIARYVRLGDGLAQRPLREQFRRRYWTETRAKEAIRAWINRHGRPPTTGDWTPSQIRARNWSTTAARIAAFEEGWTDHEGVHHRFPHASSVRLKHLVAQVLIEDAADADEFTTAIPPRPASR